MRHDTDVLVSVSAYRFDQVMQPKRGYGGRPHKGNRDAMMIRPKAELGELVRQAAADNGLTITDYVACILAREIGRTDLSPLISEPKSQKELPLSNIA